MTSLNMMVKAGYVKGGKGFRKGKKLIININICRYPRRETAQPRMV